MLVDMYMRVYVCIHVHIYVWECRHMLDTVLL